MLNDRGYNVTKEELEMTIEQFKETYADMRFVCCKFVCLNAACRLQS